jgi:hypothetical protein
MIRNRLAYFRRIKSFVTKKMEIISPDRIAQIPVPG